MARAPAGRAPANPYAGTYAPAGIRMNAKEFKAGLKGLKIRQPNKKYSENAYKSAIPKEYSEQP
jgi:hypothetical protein